MLRIDCPNCGLRDHTEFTYAGDASRTYPGLDGDMRTWVDYVFLRDNPRGRHVEFWHHVQGCRRVLRVERDTLTHEIFAVSEAAAVAAAPPPDNTEAADITNPPDAEGTPDNGDIEVSGDTQDTEDAANKPDVTKPDEGGGSNDA